MKLSIDFNENLVILYGFMMKLLINRLGISLKMSQKSSDIYFNQVIYVWSLNGWSQRTTLKFLSEIHWQILHSFASTVSLHRYWKEGTSVLDEINKI